MATGRSDYPNQVNNVLGFPFIFRGALDVASTHINEKMKLAAARALAELCVADCASGDQVVCLAVVDFLDKTCGTPRVDADRIQRLRDLKTLLQSQADQRQYRAWVQSWYP